MLKATKTKFKRSNNDDEFNHELNVDDLKDFNCKGIRLFVSTKFQDLRLIKLDLHMTKNLGNYNVIIGKDILEIFQMGIWFSCLVAVWDRVKMLFRDGQLEDMASHARFRHGSRC